MSRRFLALLLAALLLLPDCARQEAPEREETGFFVMKDMERLHSQIEITKIE